MALVGPLVAFAATLVLSLAAALQVSRALDRLVAVAARLATGELGQRAAVERSDEIGELAKAFNAMAEKLDARAVQNARLGDLGQMLQASIDTEEACQVFARLAPALLQAPAGSVAIFNASRNLLSPLSHWGTAGAGAGRGWLFRSRLSNGPRDVVLREPVALRGEDTAELLLQRSLKMVGSSDRPVARLPGIAQAPRCEGHPVLAYNVLRFTTAREPTVRAAKGCPPPLPEAVLTRLRWPAAEGRDAAKAC
jgi:HAMP domain-containing protein